MELPFSLKTAPPPLDSIDLVSQAEFGDARELVTEQLQSPSRRAGMRGMYLVRSTNGTAEYTLSRDSLGTEFVLLARTNTEMNRFDIFHHKPGEPQYDGTSPDFTMTWSDDKLRWIAALSKSVPCDRCIYKRRNSVIVDDKPVILWITQGMEKSTVSEQHWFDMSIRGLSTEFGDRVVLCKACQSDSSPTGTRKLPEFTLQSVLPTISKKGELSIRFLTSGRNVLPSARNLQVKALDDRVVLQFLRMDPLRFFLDFSSPLSPIQALSIALSTHFWI